jgi:hypothetical protein
MAGRSTNGEILEARASEQVLDLRATELLEAPRQEDAPASDMDASPNEAPW